MSTEEKAYAMLFKGIRSLPAYQESHTEYHPKETIVKEPTSHTLNSLMRRWNGCKQAGLRNFLVVGDDIIFSFHYPQDLTWTFHALKAAGLDVVLLCV